MMQNKFYNIDPRSAWQIFGPYRYDGWLYGKYDPDARSFEAGNRTAYIYHDLTSVLIGKFDKGVLVEGRASRIKYFR